MAINSLDNDIKSDKLTNLLKILWFHVGAKRKYQFSILLILMILSALMELISIGSVLPFIVALSAPEKLLSMEWIKFIADSTQLNNLERLKIALTIIFCLAALFAGILRLIHLWYQTRLGHQIGADIGAKIYEVTLNKPFSYHASRNSSEIISAISTKANRSVYEVILPALSLVSSVVIFLIVFTILLYFNPLLMSVTFSMFAIIYIAVSYFTKKKLSVYGKIVSKNQNFIFKILQEGLGGIRDVILEGNQKKYLEQYVKADEPLKSAQANILIISSCPRFIVESLGMISIACIGYLLTGENGDNELFVPTLATLAVGAQRLLPLLQLFYYSLSTAKGGEASLQDVVSLIDEPPASKPIDNYVADKIIRFNKEIELVDIEYSYTDNINHVLRGVSLKIKKGDNIGIIGETGCGKSTLLDLIMGLLPETNGSILIDGQQLNEHNRKCWRKNISHVPQNIFLFDSTIAENICYSTGIEKINYELLSKVCRIADLTSFIHNLPQGYDTYVGERGAKISGGQKQRIGIARALYRELPVLIMDEATSALDNDTERRIIASIEKEFKNTTMIHVAHRLTSLKYCNRIIKIQSGKIDKIGVLDEFIL